MAGLNPAPIDYAGVPRITYSDPEVASVGLTEAQAKEKYGEIKTLTYDLAGNGRSQILKTTGAVKLIQAEDGPVVGIHMVGSRVGELIAEAQLIYNWEAEADDVASLIHPHPTQSEALGEAHLALAGKPLHVHGSPLRLPLPHARRSPAPMPTSVTMPALGESVTEGTVTRWLKQEGEQVEADEPLLEVSTDKVDTEIPSPASGVLSKILVAEDETVEVGAELAVIGGDGAASDAAPAQEAPREEAPAGGPCREAPAASPRGGAGAGTARRRGAAGTGRVVRRWRRDVGDDARARGERHRGHRHPLAEGRRRRGDRRRAAARGVHGQGRHRDPGAGQRHAAVDRRERGRDRRRGRGARGHRFRRVRRRRVVGAAPAPKAEQRPEPTPAPANRGRRGVRPGGGCGAAAPQPAAPPTAPAPQPAARRLPCRSGRRGWRRCGCVRDAAGPSPGRRPRGRPRQRLGHRRRRSDPQAGRPRRRGEGSRPPPAAPRRRRAPAAARTPSPAATPDTSVRGRTEKLSRLRAVIARRMVESLQVSAQLTTVVEADVTRIANLRQQAKGDFEAREGVKLSFLPFFAKAAIEALKAHPSVNSSIDQEAGTVTYHDTENLGIAVDTERGLLVPVIHEAGDLSLGGIARKIADLAERTRTNKITPGRAGWRHLHADQHR